MTDLLISMERRWRDKPWVLVLLAFLINGVALVLSHNYLDGDTHTRTFMALQWLKHPFFIYIPNDITWVFAPLHCYLNAIALAIWNDPSLTTRLLSLILTSLTIFPLYHSVRLLFDERAAFYSAIFCCFCTLFIHPSAIGASEGINLFFLFTSLYFFLRYRASFRWRDMLLSAFAALAADMMRYDSWPFVSMLTLLLLIFAFTDTRKARFSVRLTAIFKAIVFGSISHHFVFIWMGAQWIKFGNPTYMTVNDLDAPQIAQNIERYGRLMVNLYQFGFLPGVMFLCAPVAFAFAVVGFYRVVRSRRFNVLFWVFAVMVFYYLQTFVITLSRYPLARFTTIPTILFICFSGVGFAFVMDRLPEVWRRRVIPVLALITILVPIGLGFFSRPSDNGIAEKLRAISPVTNPPTYYFDFVDDCRKTIADGGRLLLDTRNYNHRLLYLDLYRYHEQIDYFWPSTDSLLSFIGTARPPFVVRTDFPRPDKPTFDTANGSDSITAAGVKYHLLARRGIYCLYALDPS
jgi:4-amino-4-deoxy-L-arabinose transferase-like glycosyltransferase